MAERRPQLDSHETMTSVEKTTAVGFLAPSLPSLPRKTRTQPRCCAHDNCPKKNQVARRAFLRVAAGAAVIHAAGLLPDPVSAEPEPNEEESPDAPADPSAGGCRNCQGGGRISCELCSGTGFWRALASNDPNQRYKGVVCPECEGSGRLTCPVCLGTGEGNVKGLLRRRRVEPGPGRILQST